MRKGETCLLAITSGYFVGLWENVAVEPNLAKELNHESDH